MRNQNKKITGADYEVSFPKKGFAEICIKRRDTATFKTVQFASFDLWRSARPVFHAQQKNKGKIRSARETFTIRMLQGEFGKVHSGTFLYLKSILGKRKSKVELEPEVEPEVEDIDWDEDLDFSFM